MILDSGIASVFARHNIAQPGAMPVYGFERIVAGWYGILSFSSTPTYLQQTKESARVALKIRMQQDLRITTQDTVVLMDTAEVPASAQRYEVVRVWHGTDDQTGALISDIDLEAITP